MTNIEMTTKEFSNISIKDTNSTAKASNVFNLASEGQIDQLKHLSRQELHKRDENGASVLLYAAKNMHVEVIKMLMELSPSLFFTNDNRGQNALHYAAKNTKLNDIDRILSFINICTKFDENCLKVQDEIGLTPLHVAVSRNNEEFVKSLMKYKSYLNIEAVDNFGSTALIESVKCGWTNICR
ncbi:unnamed protein product [Dimorphilus gyrociliatus]|uniref:Uncharacterized protein n=1 Tax=Dimorphilus gyrociliatus TaxID=2664684 RepID=A0A7I8V8J9_9ANNE|nr:unnamed protein product [Dimorphilus gyrociliatus]